MLQKDNSYCDNLTLKNFRDITGTSESVLTTSSLTGMIFLVINYLYTIQKKNLLFAHILALIIAEHMMSNLTKYIALEVQYDH